MSDIRELLHGINNELSIAVLELELLLEPSGMDPESRESLARALDACRRAAVGIRQGWALAGTLDGSPYGPGATARDAPV